MGTRRVKVVRHLTDEELSVAVAKADDPKVVRRLCFIGNLYAGDTLKEATRRVGQAGVSGASGSNPGTIMVPMD